MRSKTSRIYITLQIIIAVICIVAAIVANRLAVDLSKYSLLDIFNNLSSSKKSFDVFYNYHLPFMLYLGGMAVCLVRASLNFRSYFFYYRYSGDRQPLRFWFGILYIMLLVLIGIICANFVLRILGILLIFCSIFWGFSGSTNYTKNNY